MTFVYVADPNAEELTTPPPHTPATSDKYQQVAAHTLEALSTAATDHISYPPQATAYYTATPANAHVDYGFVRGEPGAGVGGPANNIDFLLNPQGQTPASMIDPTLESSVAQALEQVGESKPTVNDDKTPHQDGKNAKEPDEGMGDSDSRVALALKSFNETPT